MKIGIFGTSRATDSKIIAKVEKIGEIIASKKHEVVTGGVSGYPYTVALSALSQGGKAIAYGAGLNMSDHKSFYDVDLSKYSQTIFQDRYVGDELSKIDLYFRSLKLCFNVDCGIFIGGRVGTMYELTILSGLAKDIYVLGGSGGITHNTVKSFLEEGHKEDSKVIFFESPEELEDYL